MEVYSDQLSKEMCYLIHRIVTQKLKSHGRHMKTELPQFLKNYCVRLSGTKIKHSDLLLDKGQTNLQPQGTWKPKATISQSGA